jgi:26S proteasome subunit RPN7
MGPYYRSITSISDPSSSSTVALEKDDALLKELEAKNAEELKKLDEKLAEAEKNEGETEISEALKARAFYFTKIGDKVRLSSPSISTLSCIGLTAMTIGRSPPSANPRHNQNTRPRLTHRPHTHTRQARFLLLRPYTYHQELGRGGEVD